MVCKKFTSKLKKYLLFYCEYIFLMNTSTEDLLQKLIGKHFSSPNIFTGDTARSPFSRLGDSEKLRPDGSTQTPDFRRPRSSFEPSTRSLGSTCRATPTPRSSSENSIRSPRSCAASANPEDAATSANLDGVATSANPEVVETNYFLFDDNEFMKSTKNCFFAI